MGSFSWGRPALILLVAVAALRAVFHILPADWFLLAWLVQLAILLVPISLFLGFRWRV